MYTDEDRQSALTRALIMAGGAMTQPGAGGFMAALGRGGMMGAQAYHDTFNDLAQRKMREEALRRSALEDKLKEIAMARQEAVAKIMGGDYSPARPAGMSGPAMADAPDWKSSPMNAGSSAAAPSVRAQAATAMDPSAELRAKADALARFGAIPEAKTLQEYLKASEEEFSPDVRYDQNGRAFLTSKRGGKKYLDGITARDEIVAEDLGGKKVYRTKFSTQPLGEIAKTVSADTLYNAANPAAVKEEGVNGSRWVFPPGRGQGGGQPSGMGNSAPGVSGNSPQGQPGVQPAPFISKSQAEREDAIRKEFRATPAVQNYETVIPILNAAEKAGDTRIGDVNLVYAAAKMFDPTSVVRESEYGTVVSANNIPNWLQGHVNALMGGGKLSAGARKELMAELNARVAAHEDMYKQVRGTYEGIARSQGLDPSRIFTDFPRVGSSRRKQGAIGKAQGSGARTVNFNDLPD